MSEEKIIVTRTTYGFKDAAEYGPFAIESVVTKVESDGEVIYERRMAEHLLRKQPERCSPVECFIDYIQNLAGGQPQCCRDKTIRSEVIKIINEIFDSDNKDVSTGSHTYRVGIEFIDHSENSRERIVTVNGKEFFRDNNTLEQYGNLNDSLRKLELWLFDLDFKSVNY